MNNNPNPGKLPKTLDNPGNNTQTFSEPVREFTTFERSIYNRMMKCIKAKGLPKTQDLTRLAVSIFLDKEGF